MTEIQVVYFDGCPSWQLAATHLRTALAAAGRSDTPVEFVGVRTGVEAAAARFAGSPTLLVDGHDLFPGTPPTRELTCRLYPDSSGVTGVPSVAALTDALASRLTPPCEGSA